MTFKIGIHYPKREAPVTPYITAFETGLKRHDVQVESVFFPDQVTDCDLAVCWNHRNHRLFTQQKDKGRDYLVLERGFIGGRTKWTALCFNGLNGHADWSHCDNSPGDRFYKYHSELMKDYVLRPGGIFLIIGQVPGDSSLAGINIDQWYAGMVRKSKEIFPCKKVVFRPHPVCIDRKYKLPVLPTGIDEISTNACGYSQEMIGNTLLDDLDRASCVVTMNSNTGVESVFAGVPTLTFSPGSMAYDVTEHAISDGYEMIDRTQWAYDLAYKQWNLEELENGDAWDHARKRYDL